MQGLLSALLPLKYTPLGIKQLGGGLLTDAYLFLTLSAQNASVPKALGWVEGGNRRLGT